LGNLIYRAALTLAAAILLCRPSLGEPPAELPQPAPFFQLQDLGHGVWAAISTPDGKAGSNSGFVIGTEAVLSGSRRGKRYLRDRGREHSRPQ